MRLALFAATLVPLAACAVDLPPPPPPLPVDLACGYEPLREAFNASAAEARVIGVLSPNCDYSAVGLDLIRRALETLGPEAPVAVLLVWVDEVPGDSAASAAEVTERLGDCRVQAFHDSELRASRALAMRTLPLASARRSLMLYEPGQIWQDDPPAPCSVNLLFEGLARPEERDPSVWLRALELCCLVARTM